MRVKNMKNSCDVEAILVDQTDEKKQFVSNGFHFIPRTNLEETKLSMAFDNQIEFIWKDLCYSVQKTKNIFDNENKKVTIQLIKNLSGSLVSGRLTGIMGPSGAGKTTLIECLSGRRKAGVTGHISANCNGMNRKLRLSYYSQRDSLMGQLTVSESLLYASQLKNCQKKSRKRNPMIDGNANEYSMMSAFPDETIKLKLLNEKYYHQLIVKKMLNDLGLEQCASTRVSNCSGGQARRLSIALELIFSPSIFLLDEPTSGLDSLSCLQCVKMLRSLTRLDKPMVIAASLHQPSATVLSNFDYLYILSVTGQCIYNGPTSLLLDHLNHFSLVCPQFHNPADFAIEVASGDYGLAVIKDLADCESKRIIDCTSNDSSIKLSKIIHNSQTHVLTKQTMTTWILLKRCLFITTRDPILYWLRFFITVLTVCFVYVLFMKNKTGAHDACFKAPNFEMINSLDSFQNSDIMNALNTVYPNFGFIFSTVLFLGLVSILPTLLTFPLEVSVFIKENFNGWYSLGSFYIAKSLSDIPPNIIFPTLFAIPTYFITGQLFEWWRFIMFITISVMFSFLTQSFGFLVSAFYVNNVNAATCVGSIINVPLFLFTGLLIPINSMPRFIQPLTYISYFRLSFEALMVVVYGYGRCKQIEPLAASDITSALGDNLKPLMNCVIRHDFFENATQLLTSSIDAFNEKIANSNPSFALQNYGFEDYILIKNIIYMILYTIILRTLAYIILRWRTRPK